MIAITINGERREVESAPGRTLLRYLRDDLGLTGTKEGCRQGECGACTVLVDGTAVNSCMVYLDGLDGADITTIEGLAKSGELDAVQRAFVECGAIQCGFCSPGMIMSAKALLLKNKRPTEHEIRTAISGNLCRCTGYKKIVEAVEVAAGIRPSPIAGGDASGAVGKKGVRPDLEDKATGRALYADDLRIPGLLIARAKRSPLAHAMIRHIDVEAARSARGVVAVLTAEDIPGLPYCGQVFKDMPVICRDKVYKEGDPVAVVVAETEEEADAAVELISVEYEPLPVISTVEEAMEDGAVQIHESGNIRQTFNIRKGAADLEAIFAECEAVAEETFITQISEHAYIETECSVAYFDPENGLLTVCSPTQEVFSDRRQIAASMAMPQNKIRVKQTVVGGAFGGKIDISTEIIAALAAYRTMRPVKYRYDRYESMAVSTKRHPFKTTIRMGAGRDGRIKAMKASVYVDNGAYSSMGAKVVQKGCINMSGPYKIENAAIDTYLVYTNRPFGGAMRGFGIPQVAFAYESCMSMLAAKLGMSEHDIRMINASSVGDTTLSGKVLETANIREHLEAADAYVKSHPLEARRDGPTIKHGRGMAAFVYPIGLGFGTNDTSTVMVRLCDDGSIIVMTGASDLGQGSDDVMRRIAAEELGADPKSVLVTSADSAHTPFAGLSSGSRQTYITGRATMEAAKKVAESTMRAACEITGASRERIGVRGGHVFVDGRETETTFAQLASYCYMHAYPQVGVHTSDITKDPVSMETGQGDPFSDFVYGVHVADVSVDTRTGELTVERIVAVHDVGKIIDPISLEGQIDGALSMGYGQTSMEEVIVDGGRLITRTLAEYMIPTSLDMPQIEFVPLETPSKLGPYGARGVAEPPVVGVAPAIASAIFDAVGVRATELPITQERLLALIEGKR